ncbi:hypothetical protein V490_01716 [Pseudogymnoascus sp. VKM F-3557]|nr:hypothetical protein V490_01716 [Pseudogymnoascus sp. VKM F-3557]
MRGELQKISAFAIVDADVKSPLGQASQLLRPKRVTVTRYEICIIADQNDEMHFPKPRSQDSQSAIKTTSYTFETPWAYHAMGVYDRTVGDRHPRQQASLFAITKANRAMSDHNSNEQAGQQQPSMTVTATASLFITTETNKSNVPLP